MPKFFSLKDLFEIDYKHIDSKVFKMFEISDEIQEQQNKDILSDDQSGSSKSKLRYRNFQYVQIKRQRDGSKMEGHE